LSARTSRTARAGLTAALIAVAAATVTWAGTAAGAAPTVPSQAVPSVPCAAGALPESTQGRVPLAEVESGRAAKGYRCNTVQVGHHGESGGYHVWRYEDAAGRVCAYYDSTLLLGRDLLTSAVRRGPGVYVLDMTDPSKPVQTAVLATPAMLQPHESLRLNEERGLLVAVAGSPATAPGVLDVYDVSQDCRNPVLKSTSPLGVLGHESGFAPDGMTYWAASYLNGEATLQAIDLADPGLPKLLLITTDYALHGISLSDDGKRLYGADQSFRPGLQLLDVSDVQQRKPNPQIRQVSFLTWPEVSIPQVSEPITIDGRPYLMEVDEFANGTTGRVGAARLIDVSNEERPNVVSNIRLRVNQPEEQKGEQREDLGHGSLQGYTAHYCSVPRRKDPHLMACSFILSGLRIFDIRNPQHPVEVGYFNVPVRLENDAANPVTRAGAFAMSGPAWDIAGGQVWYSDANNGLYAVRLVGAAAAALRGTSPVPAADAATASRPPTRANSPTMAAEPAAAGDVRTQLPATGSSALTALAAACLIVLGLAGARLHRSRLRRSHQPPSRR
jgi:hypothetical protein